MLKEAEKQRKVFSLLAFSAAIFADIRKSVVDYGLQNVWQIREKSHRLHDSKLRLPQEPQEEL